jgi:hypothetical protein
MFSCGHYYVFLGFLCFLEKKTGVEGNSWLSLPPLPSKRKKKNKLAWKVDCPLSNWCGPLSTPNTTWKKETPHLSPSTYKKEREAPSLNDATSHWLHENSITKIGLDL